MLSESQLTEIRNYLLSKKLPIDILIEVNDHFVSQISDLQREENLNFEEAFEKTKENWKEEFKTTVPFYVLANKDKRAITNFEKKIRQEENFSVLKTSSLITLAYFISYIIAVKFYKIDNQRLYTLPILIFPFIVIFYNLIFNRIFYKKKYQNLRFSIFHWRIYFIFSFGYFGLQYIKPINKVIENINQNNFNFETIIKTFIFFLLVLGYTYTGIAQLKFAKTVKKIKPFLKYL